MLLRKQLLNMISRSYDEITNRIGLAVYVGAATIQGEGKC